MDFFYYICCCYGYGYTKHYQKAESNKNKIRYLKKKIYII